MRRWFKESFWKAEVQTAVLGVIAYLCLAANLIVPPLKAPENNFLWLLVFGMMVLPPGATSFGLAVYCLVRKRWKVLFAAAPLVLLLLALPKVSDWSNDLWVNHFHATVEERNQFLKFMRSQKVELENSAYERVALPPHWKISDSLSAYISKDEEGNLFYSYSAYTYGIDNSWGFSYSESGKPPFERSYPVIVWSQALGGGWFMFRST